MWRRSYRRHGARGPQCQQRRDCPAARPPQTVRRVDPCSRRRWNGPWRSGTSPRSAYAELAWLPKGNDATEIAAEWQARAETAVNDRNSDFADGYATFALRARQQYRLSDSSRLELLARVDNVFDREYASSVIVNDGNGRFFEPGSPRAWLLSVKWRQAF